MITSDYLPTPEELHDLVLTVYHNKKPFYKYEAIINYIVDYLNKHYPDLGIK